MPDQPLGSAKQYPSGIVASTPTRLNRRSLQVTVVPHIIFLYMAHEHMGIGGAVMTQTRVYTAPYIQRSITDLHLPRHRALSSPCLAWKDGQSMSTPTRLTQENIPPFLATPPRLICRKLPGRTPADPVRRTPPPHYKSRPRLAREPHPDIARRISSNAPHGRHKTAET